MDSSPSTNIPEWSARQVIYATLVVVAILALFALVYRFSNVIFILLISIVLSTGIRPAVQRMSRRGVPRPIGVIIVYLAALVILILIGIFIVPLFVEQITDIGSKLPGYYLSLRSSLVNSPSHIVALISSRLPEALLNLTNRLTTPGAAPLPQMATSVAYLGYIMRGIFILTAILFLAFYWTLQGERSTRGMLLWLPMSRREQLREFIADAEDKVGAFILGQGILCLAIGIMAFIAYSLIGLPNALVLAILAGVMEAVPIIGPVLGHLPAFLVALPIGPSKAILVIASSLITQLLENYVLAPRVMNKAVGVNPLLVLLTIAAFTSLFGLAGALLSIPIAAVIQLALNRFIIRPSDTELQPSEGRGQISLLRYEVHDLAQDMRKQIRQGEQIETKTDQLVDSLEAIALDLDQILADAENRMEES